MPFPRGLVRAHAKGARPCVNTAAHFHFQAVPEELVDFDALALLGSGFAE